MSPAADTPRRTVLVVEDESAMAELLAINLLYGGFQPVLARDGRTADALLQWQSFAAVLLDWTLPDESGLSLLRRWRSDRRLLGLPILIVSGRDTPQEIHLARQAGVDDYLVKPFSTQEMMRRVRRLLPVPLAPSAA